MLFLRATCIEKDFFPLVNLDDNQCDQAILRCAHHYVNTYGQTCPLALQTREFCPKNYKTSKHWIPERLWCSLFAINCQIWGQMRRLRMGDSPLPDTR
eukprot:scaffold9060_cov108-Skeletonema_marinoi.AAC.7